MSFAVDRLRGVVIENKSGLDLMRQHDGLNTVYYVDPPYVLSTRKQGGNPCCKKGYKFEMTDDDHRDLADILRSLNGMVVLSGYAFPLYDEELYPDWKRVERLALADGARPRTEVLWLNKAADLWG